MDDNHHTYQTVGFFLMWINQCRNCNFLMTLSPEEYLSEENKDFSKRSLNIYVRHMRICFPELSLTSENYSTRCKDHDLKKRLQ